MPHGDFVLGYFHSVAVGEGHRVQVLTSALCLNREEGKGHIHRSKVSLRDWGREGEGTEQLMLNQAGGALESPPSGHSAARRLGQVCWPHFFKAESSAGSGSSLPSE